MKEGSDHESFNPMLRGWVNYFGCGNSSLTFGFIKAWVEKKVRRHLIRNSKRRGIGWKRWSTSWLYTQLGLFNEYRVTYTQPQQKALPAG